MTPERPSTIPRLLATLCLATLMVPSCADPPRHWPTTAASAAQTLEKSGLTCREEGRELYPVMYACAADASEPDTGIFLYANDRNDLVGIRAFSPISDPGTLRLFELAVDLAYGENVPAELGSRETQRITAGGTVLETGADEGVRYIRITPLSEIRSQSE